MVKVAISSCSVRKALASIHRFLFLISLCSFVKFTSPFVIAPNKSFWQIHQNHDDYMVTTCPQKTTWLHMAYGNGRNHMDKSKRQQRMGHFVQSALADILRRGFPLVKSSADSGRGISEDLRRRISIVDVDMAPDLRQARVTVSVIGNKQDIPEKRRAYSWMVTHTKSIRHALARRMDHMKVLPNLTFVLADVAAAVDVMALIDQVSSGRDKREDVLSGEDDYFWEGSGNKYWDTSSGAGGLLDFGDDGEDDEEWIEDDDNEDDDYDFA